MRKVATKDLNLEPFTYKGIIDNFGKIHPFDTGNKPLEIKAGFIIYNKDGGEAILVRDTASGKYGFPKGSYDNEKDKNILQTAIRELYEETGIKISPQQITYGLQHVFKFTRNKKACYSFYVYVIVELNNEELHDIFNNAHIDLKEISAIKLLNFRKLNYLCQSKINNVYSCTYVTQIFIKYLMNLRSC